ncbi:MAG TPA: HAD family hydrolase [Gammaproteobacteria bacterium]|nr:HAD family hydrolase [Gammaproteobacteria bacterium]
MNSARTTPNSSPNRKENHGSALMAIFFDWDGVLCSIPEDKEDNTERKLIDPNELVNIIKASTKHKIPLHIITARPDSEKQLIVNELELLKESHMIEAFQKGIGGFHLEDIYCLGIEQKSKKKKGETVVIGTRQTKAKTIEEILANNHPGLDKTKTLFIDDDEKHITLAQSAGYPVIHAKQNTKSYLKDVLETIQKTVESKHTKLYSHHSFFNEAETTQTTSTNLSQKISKLHLVKT